ncbi:neuritin isoform X1 [Chrysemys picta bellii]|uniref:neuritin isoform X1 n=1 Tax=Chrysemys picta bellii TaxID=8478 RepID=UPI001C669AC4|nr:neuritin isoform X1 [Chrysemys picta bellii]
MPMIWGCLYTQGYSLLFSLSSAQKSQASLLAACSRPSFSPPRCRLLLLRNRPALQGEDKPARITSRAYLVQAVRAAGKCDAVFRGFSDCLLRLGDNMANYPQDLDDKRNLQTICSYWDDFHSCTLTALTDCQEGATDLWEKLKRESKNLDFQGSLFELCGGSNGSAPSLLLPAFPLLLLALSAALMTWFSF